MKQEQIDVLNITQQVLRGVITSLLSIEAVDAMKLSRALEAFASAPGIEPVASQMLADLAAGPGMIAGAGKTRQ